MIMNLSGGGKAKNVLAIWNGDSGATITATLGSKVLTTETDSSGYAFLTNLDAGTWTLQATKTGRYVGAVTVTVTSTQTAYYIRYPFQTYAYDGSLNDAGSTGANVCADFSGGWDASGGGGTTTYNFTNLTRSAGTSYVQNIYNQSAIDLTPFNTLYVKCSCVSGNMTVGITTTSNGSTYRTSGTVSDTSINTVSLDVTGFNNLNGYLKLSANGTIVLYSAWFE